MNNPMECLQIKRVEKLDEGLERLYADCPKCQRSEAMVMDVEFEEGEEFATFFKMVSPKCEGCGTKFVTHFEE